VTGETESPWWRGDRGEWYVAIQVVLMGVVFFGPRTLPGLPPWPPAAAQIAVIVGAALVLVGGLLFLAALVRLGPNLTPLPRPKPGATLVQSGPYRLVRHPIYAGGLSLAYGWALLVGGWLTLGYATVLLAFLDLKSAREERWLTETFPDYPAYRRRVRKLIPFVY
jgi:protein-S-isoprenylcysteine O-methyltransferase Ste14